MFWYVVSNPSLFKTESVPHLKVQEAKQGDAWDEVELECADKRRGVSITLEEGHNQKLCGQGARQGQTAEACIVTHTPNITAIDH